ncbi:hypothetical protein BDZ90DRAFT_258534 [Jaminaea rosea]|uniref:Wax synthase domain-containing protein n=1 Tax=Jaminaea rosea TaxID=1569628 RepID=A0A316UZ74_9BASI|nr:hypothetical protein BDZ90DRAFT_258534 [Jaminaea rosea]PWN29621.1 hypothetical protein BDZ90DRAFT_258534 [Jaminaea rosea]
MNVIGQLLASHYEYAHHVLLDPPARLARGYLFHASGVATLATTLGWLLVFIIGCHVTLPNSSPTVSMLRLFALPWIVAVSVTCALDRERFSLGGDFRDVAIPSAIWLVLAEAIKVCLVTIWDGDKERAPRWIVPESQAHKWEGAVKIEDDEQQSQQGNGKLQKPHATVARRFDLPATWYIVPHPPLLSFRRLVWALDNFAMRRPGTSLLFPGEQRAMEWAYKPMIRSAAVYERAAAAGDAKEAARIRESAPIWFGQLEYGWLGVLIQAAMLYGATRFIFYLDLKASKGPYDFYSLPLVHQYALTFSLGALVAFTFSPLEYILGPLLYALRFPATALIPAFQRPMVASGPTDFWSRRWHQFLRKDFTTLAKLLPGSRESKTLLALWTFSVSAMEHSLVFSRFKATPPTMGHAFWLLLNPSLQGFFVSQGLLILLEQALLGRPKPRERLRIRVVRRSLLWIGLLTTGRWVAGFLVSLGVLDPTEVGAMFKVASVWDDIQRERRIEL